MGCNTQFWFGRRKHHCRSCGKLFCSECSEKYLPIPSEQLYHPVRVCDLCFSDLGEEGVGEGEEKIICDKTAEEGKEEVKEESELNEQPCEHVEN